MRLGLGSRLTLAIVGVLVLLQALGLLTALHLRGLEGPVWRAQVPARLAAAAQALDDLSPEARVSLLRALNGDETRFFLTDELPQGYRRLDGPAALFSRGNRQAFYDRDLVILVPEVRRGWRPRARADIVDYVFSVKLEDGRRLNVAPGQSQRRRGVTMAFLALSAFMTLAAAILTWRLVRLAIAQLEAISLAADHFAADMTSPAMVETGPAEARRVSAAFNRMRGEIRRLMDERLRMLAAVAHDLKTLLTRLRLRVALIEDETQRARGDRDIAEMALLIEDVLQVARGEDRPPLLISTDVERLVVDLVATRREAGDPIILGRCEPISACAEASHLRRVLENLVDNAIAYAGNAELTIRRSGDAYVEICVVDHGPGIAKEFLASAFEPFTRQETSRSRQTGGAGLGLAIAHALAKQMKGEVVLTETPGGGLTAIVRLVKG